eukprot:4202254-Karenia_brevis.AAC.1
MDADTSDTIDTVIQHITCRFCGSTLLPKREKSGSLHMTMVLMRCLISMCFYPHAMLSLRLPAMGCMR